MRPVFLFAFLWAAAVLAAPTSPSETSAAVGKACRKDLDCPGRLLCEQHLCFDPRGGTPEAAPAPAPVAAAEAPAPAPLAPPGPAPRPETPPAAEQTAPAPLARAHAVPRPETLPTVTETPPPAPAPAPAPPPPVVVAAAPPQAAAPVLTPPAAVAPPPPLAPVAPAPPPPAPVAFPPSVAAPSAPPAPPAPPLLVASAEPPPPEPTPAEDWEAPIASRGPAAVAAEAKPVDGYRGAAWGLWSVEFQHLKGAAPPQPTRDVLSTRAGSDGLGDAAWSDTLALLLGTPVTPSGLLVQALPARFSSAVVAHDEAQYLFFDGRLVGALVQVGAGSYDALRAKLAKRFKGHAAPARKVPAREGHPGGRLALETGVNGGTRIFLARLEYPSAPGGDVVTSVRLLYFSGPDFDRISQNIQRAAAQMTKARPIEPEGTEKDLGKLP